MTTVVKARSKGVTGYAAVHRRTAFGNPYKVEEYGREKAVKMFRIYFLYRVENEPDFRNAVLSLRDRVLGCTCPQYAIDSGECHACVIAEWLNSQEIAQ